jgi:hypothetical protein
LPAANLFGHGAGQRWPVTSGEVSNGEQRLQLSAARPCRLAGISGLAFLSASK